MHRTLILELVKGHQGSCLNVLETMLEVEGTPFTQNGHYLEASSDKWLALYKDTRAGRAVGEQRQLKKQRTGAQDTVTAAPIPIWDASKILEPEMQAAEPQARSSSTTPVLKGFTFKPTASSNTQRNGFSLS